ncbi:hypothetical protein LINGRAHAP2_LOCUS7512 [Linum grandiflorum]
MTFRFRYSISKSTALFLASQGIYAAAGPAISPPWGFFTVFITVSRRCLSDLSLIFRASFKFSYQAAVACGRFFLSLSLHRSLVSFQLLFKKARATAYQKQPWCYKNHVINLIPWELPSQEVFDRLQFMPITIQLRDLPSHCNTVEFGKEILAPVEVVLSASMYTERPHGDGRPFPKVIVKMNLMASFPGKVEAVVEGEPPFDVYLRYEDLPMICYLCGLLGHVQRYCDHGAKITPVPGLRGGWMLAKPFGHLVEDLDCSATATSKKKNKYLKPLPCVFFSDPSVVKD